MSDEPICECGCTRRAHANGLFDCRYHRETCTKFRPAEVPDIFAEQEDEKP